MTIPRSFVLATWRVRRWRRARSLRRSYREQVPAITSLEARVAYHMELLSDYWSRCDGFLDCAWSGGHPIDGSFLTADWVQCQVIGTREADSDLRAFAARTERAPLSMAWAEYENIVNDLGSSLSADEDMLLRARRAFEVVVEKLKIVGSRRHFPPNHDARRTFADFLERLAEGPRPPADWSDLVATHYHDSELESLRREVASRVDEFCQAELEPRARADLLDWARRLREQAG